MSARPETDSESPGVPRLAMVGIIATVTVFAVSQGLSYPLLSFILQRQGESPAMIGASAAMTPLGFILSAPLIPMLAARFGAARLAILCALLAAVMLALIGLVRDPLAWFPLRLLLGFAANPLYVVSETWLLTITPASIRGRLMGIYTSIVSAGFGLGPLFLTLVGSEGALPFMVGITAFLLCAICLLAVVSRLPPIDHGRTPTSVGGFVLIAPLLTFAVFTAAGFEQALLALFGVFGTAHGSAEERIAALLTTFIAGNIALQVPLGALAERVGAPRMLFLCACASAAGCVLLPALFDTVLIWPMVFAWGAASFGIYTMALIELGTRFQGALLMTGNAAFALFWGVGGIVVPPTAGLAIDGLGSIGLPVALGMLCGALAVLFAAGAVMNRKL